ncbi:MAG: type II secretion system major pseudopilin GspG [Bdellovibrionales bacterium]|nr:type II secretion system major pseudopilin GspG [Bdellovibrionales bacterium]
MTPKQKQILRDSKGMTLLEIMIVLAILGGLMAVLATQVMGRFKKANVEQTKIQINQIGQALDMYYTDCGSYPATLEALRSNTDSCNNWGPDPYLKDEPRDAWGNQLYYERDGGSYYIMSYGEDRREGGEGTAADIRSDQLGK